MKRRKSILRIAACTLSILLITVGISGVPAIAFAVDKDLAEETVVETDAEEAVVDTDTEETITSDGAVGDDAVILDINEDVSEVNPDSTLPEGGGDQVVSANTVIDKIGMDGYDAVTDDNMELYTAFYADLNLEIQGGRYFKGHEIINFGDSGSNASKVFALDEIPVEMSDNYMLFVDYYDYSSNPEGNLVYYLEKVTGTVLYAWEYEKQADGTYKRINSVPIEDFTINDDDDTMYVDLGLGHIDEAKRSFDDLQNLGTYTAPKIYSYLSDHSDMKKDYYQHVPTLPGLVRLDGSAFKDPSNPIAIAAMCYDATATEEEDLYKTESGTEDGYTWTYHEYSWHNNAGFTATESISYDWYYYGGDDNYTKYWSDEPYYASNMGSFSLRPYVYRFTDTGNEHILTLYHVTPYSLFARKIQEGRHYFDNWKAADYSQANLPIDTWKIPATYTDPLSGTTYKVRITKGGNIVPHYASKLIIEDGVGFPDDCSYLFSSAARINVDLRNLSEIVIQGNPKTVGSNITNMSYMFLGKQGREGFDATTYKSLDFAALDTSNVTDMSYLFADVTMTDRTNIDVTTLDTSKVTDFKGMFRSYHVPSGLYQPATALDLSHFNTESAVDMSEMFEGSTFSSLDLSAFDFSKVTDMSRMFTFTEYLESITFPSDMDSSKVTDMSFMFAGDYNLTKIKNITAMDTGSVTDMSGMFGAHQCNKKLIETIPMDLDPDVWSGSYKYDKFLDGFAVFNPAWVTAKLYNVNDGPAITSLDLTGFDTRNVKYANGMFYMPGLTEIKWGTDTTFEALSDAGGMFTLASVKKLDLTGRKFSNIKFAHSQAFPVEMFNLNEATELVLGEDSINLSKLSSKGQLMIKAPMLYSLDLRDVEMGANAFAGEGALNYGSPGSLQGASGLYEIYLPAGMPHLTSPTQLPGTFYDDEGGAYTVINGGYENDLHLVNPEKEDPNVKRTQTITADDVTVTYGDTDKAVSAIVTDPVVGGGGITYAVKEGSEDYIKVDANNGKLTIKAVPADGKAYVVVTAAETETHKQSAKEVTITINKASAVAATVTRAYLSGREASDRIELGDVLPVDRGRTTFVISGYAAGSYKAEPSIAENSSVLSYTLNQNSGDSITVSVTMNNYTDCTITILINRQQLVLSEKSGKDYVPRSYKKLLSGKSFTLVPSFEESGNYNKRVIWSSTNPDVASVTQDGKVTARSAGTSEIRIQSEEKTDLLASCTVSVTEPVTGVTLNKKSYSFGTGETVTLTATVLPFTAIQKLSWTVDNGNVDIAVSDDTLSAFVTGKAAGKAKVTATAADCSGKKATCSFTVGNPVPANFTVTGKGNKTAVEAGKTLNMTVDWGGKAQTPKNTGIIWSVEGENASAIASITSTGVLTGITAGTVTVRAKSAADTGKNNTVDITVLPPANMKGAKVTGISFTDRDRTALAGGLITGKSFTLKPQLTTEGNGKASGDAVAWYSSDESVATVTQKGAVKAVGAGTVTITALARDAAVLSAAPKASVTFTVKSPVKSIVPDQTKLTLGIREGSEYGRVSVSTLVPLDASDPSVEWKTNNDKVKLACVGNRTAPSTGVFTDAAAIGVTVGKDQYLAIKAVEPGVAKLTGITKDGSNKKMTVTVTVRGQVTGLSLKEITTKNGLGQVEPEDKNVNNGKYKSTLAAGGKLSLTPVVDINNISGATADKGERKTYADYKKYTDVTVSYRSSDTSVATVDKNGKISVKKGTAGKTATIYVVSADGKQKAEILITVK